MNPPRVFISATSGDLSSARQIAKEALLTINCHPVEQTNFEPDWRSVTDMLRAKIGDCQALVHLVGFRYGAEPDPASLPGGTPRRSYTQMEYHLARELGLRVYTFLLPETYPFDVPAKADTPAQTQFQAAHRALIQSSPHLYEKPANDLDLRTRIIALQEQVICLVQEQQSIAKEVKTTRRWGLWAAAAVFIALCGIAWVLCCLLIDSAHLRNPWVSDDFVSVRVSQSASGTMLGDEPYEIKLEIKNPTSMRMIVTRIDVVSKNRLAAKVLGSVDDQVFEAKNHVPHYLDGGEAKTIPISLNEILPYEINVTVYHNLASTPSRFTLDLHARELPMPSPRYLPRDKIYSGYDSLAAVRHGIEEARKWSSDAMLVAMFSTDVSVMIDPDSRLRYPVAKSWWTTFYSRRLNRDFIVVSGVSNTAEKKNDSPTPRIDVPLTDPPLPAIGFEQALDIANRGSLLSADWKDSKLTVVEIGGKSHSVWFLPYRAPSGLPVMIDAVSGEQVVLDAKGNFALSHIKATPIQESTSKQAPTQQSQ